MDKKRHQFESEPFLPGDRRRLQLSLERIFEEVVVKVVDGDTVIEVASDHMPTSVEEQLNRVLLDLKLPTAQRRRGL